MKRRSFIVSMLAVPFAALLPKAKAKQPSGDAWSSWITLMPQYDGRHTVIEIPLHQLCFEQQHGPIPLTHVKIIRYRARR